MSVAQLLELMSDYQQVTLEAETDTMFGVITVSKTMNCSAWKTEPIYKTLSSRQISHICAYNNVIVAHIEKEV